MTLAVAIFPVLIVVVVCAAAGHRRWRAQKNERRRQDEARWGAPEITTERVLARAEGDALEIRIRGHHLRVVMNAGRLLDMTFPTSEDTGFVSEAIREPHLVQFLAGDSSCLAPAAAVPGVEPCGVPSGWVRLMFNTQPGQPVPTTALMVDVPIEEAIELLRWVRRHPRQVEAVVHEDGVEPRLSRVVYTDVLP